eukprot:670885-Hanusia_phi.AAC.1
MKLEVTVPSQYPPSGPGREGHAMRPAAPPPDRPRDGAGSEPRRSSAAVCRAPPQALSLDRLGPGVRVRH